MTDHKFTDEQIIKGLSNCNDKGSCDECPFDGVRFDGEIDCASLMHENALALINRQKAEIERLNTVHADMTESLRLAAEANKDMQAEIERLESLTEQLGNDVDVKLKYIYELEEQLKTAKFEAIKEFAWRLKSRLTPYPEVPFCEMVGSLDIDALVEEMTEENK